MKSKIALLSLVLATGCVVNPIRTARDDKLLCLTTPVHPMSVSETEIRNATSPNVADIPIYADEDKIVDCDFELTEAIRLAMVHSEVVRVRSGATAVAADVTFFDIQANEAQILAELSAFDTDFKASVLGSNFKNPPDAFFGPGLIEPSERDELSANFGWTRQNELGGETSIQFNPRPSYLFIPGTSDGSFNPRHVGELEFSVFQPLLRGAGKAVNLAPLEISQIATEQSAWDFKSTVMTSVREIVTTYWDLYAAQVAVEAIETVLPLLDEIVRIQTEALEAEWITQTEVAKAKAQRHDFRREYERLQSEVRAAELRLRNLIGLPPQDGRRLIAVTPPLEQHLTPKSHEVLLTALDHQPDLVRRRLDVRVRTIEKTVALNGRRLQLDAFALYRRNGVGDKLDDALDQMFTEEFFDWQVGATLTVPLGRRQAAAAIRAAEQRLAKDRVLLEQEVLTVNHDLQDALRAIKYAYRQFAEAKEQLSAANEWAKGAKLRYENPRIDANVYNVLITNLNEYLNSLRFRTEAAAERADVLAEYNSELVRLEETKGTLLEFFGIVFLSDPCHRAASWPLPVFQELMQPVCASTNENWLAHESGKAASPAIDDAAFVANDDNAVENVPSGKTEAITAQVETAAADASMSRTVDISDVPASLPVSHHSSASLPTVTYYDAAADCEPPAEDSSTDGDFIVALPPVRMPPVDPVDRKKKVPTTPAAFERLPPTGG